MIKVLQNNSKTIHIILVLTFVLMGLFPLIPEQYEGIVVICFLATSLLMFLLNSKKIEVLKKDFFILSENIFTKLKEFSKVKIFLSEVAFFSIKYATKAIITVDIQLPINGLMVLSSAAFLPNKPM